MYIIANIVYILVAVALVIGYAHEDKIVDFENMIITKIKNHIGENGK